MFRDGPVRGGFRITSKKAHWALRTPCELVTFTFSLPAFVNNIYSSNGLIELLFTSMYTSAPEYKYILIIKNLDKT